MFSVSKLLTVLEELAIDSLGHRIREDFAEVRAVTGPDYICKHNVIESE